MKTYWTTTNKMKHIYLITQCKTKTVFVVSCSLDFYTASCSEGGTEDTCKGCKNWNILLHFTICFSQHSLRSGNVFIRTFIQCKQTDVDVKVLLCFCCWFLMRIQSDSLEKGDGRDFDYPSEFHFNKFHRLSPRCLQPFSNVNPNFTLERENSRKTYYI